MPTVALAETLRRSRDSVRAPQKKITVVHLLHSIAYGGVETILINWLRGMDRDRFDNHVVCFANPGGTERPFLHAAELARIPVRTIRWSRRKPIIRASRDLARILREVGADIVHAHNTYADIVGLVAARLVGAKTVASLYVWSDFGWKRNALQKIDEWALRHFDLIAAQCEQTRRDTIARGLPADRTTVVISGFDPPPPPLTPSERARLRASLGVAPDQVILADVARLYPEKAQDLMLRAFKKVVERHPEARLWIFGTGPLEASLKALNTSLGLDGHVRFMGFIDDVLAYMRGLDIQVHPSYAEGVPMALCVGLAAGVPVIASAVGGIPEVLDEGRAGVLIPAASDPRFEEAFVESASRLIEDVQERRRVGDAGRQFISTSYSLETAVDALQRTYLTLTNRVCESVSS